MSFANVFQGIDFQAPNRARQAEANRLQQAIGQGIAMYERAQDRDMRRRQFELREAQDQGLNLERQATEAIYKQQMGAPLSESDIAAIRAQSVLKAPSPYLDPVTQQFKRPETLAQRAGLDQAPQSRIAQVMQPSMPVSAPPAAPVGDGMPMGGQVPDFRVTGALAGTPRAAGMEAEAQLEFQREQAKSVLDRAREKREFEIEKKRGMPKAEKRLFDLAQDYNNMSSVLDNAIEEVSPFTAGAGSWLSVIGGTPAADLKSNLETIQADAAFNALQNMRANSPTGGALGAVSERELSLLQNSRAALAQDQSPAQLRQNLQNYKNQRAQSMQRVIDAYREDYGMIPESLAETLGVNEEKEQAPTRDQILQELQKRRGR